MINNTKTPAKTTTRATKAKPAAVEIKKPTSTGPTGWVKFRVGATRVIIRGVILGILVAAVYASYLEIRKSGQMLEMQPWQAGMLPLFIDGMAFAGRLMMSKLWDEATQERGSWIFRAGIALSFAGNVYAGDTPGSKVFGALVVVVVLVLENSAVRMIAVALKVNGKPRKTRTPAQQEASTAKGKVTRASNAVKVALGTA